MCVFCTLYLYIYIFIFVYIYIYIYMYFKCICMYRTVCIDVLLLCVYICIYQHIGMFHHRRQVPNSMESVQRVLFLFFGRDYQI